MAHLVEFCKFEGFKFEHARIEGYRVALPLGKRSLGLKDQDASSLRPGTLLTDGTVQMPLLPPKTDEIRREISWRYLGLLAHAKQSKRPDTLWWHARPLSEARNAHATNTARQFHRALMGPYNFFEGDVRAEITHGDRLEMRHDPTHEFGDNLTLKEWLELGKASGRGLKLDVKEPAQMQQVLQTVRAVGVPVERLIFNLSYDGMSHWGAEIRRQFPSARLALNPPEASAELSDDAVANMLAQARHFGPPFTFVVRYDLLTDRSINLLEAAGPISVWNSDFNGRSLQDPDSMARALRSRGISGVIDLRKSKVFWGKVDSSVDWAANAIITGFDKMKLHLAKNATRVKGFIVSALGAVGSFGKKASKKN